MSEPIHIISLGAGVQSSTMALMAAHGEITPMPTAAVFADTHAEPSSVYSWLDWLEKQLPFPVHRVSAGNLEQESLRVFHRKKDGRAYIKGHVPAYIKTADGSMSPLWRTCTADFKLAPLSKFARKLGEIKRGEKDVKVIEWIGISLDESHRMKPSRDRWLKKRWPLIDAGINRHDCLRWMEKKGFPTPPRSACTFCPFHSDAEWHRLKTQEPDAFAHAAAYEVRLQEASRLAGCHVGNVTLHRSGRNITEVDFDPSSTQGQQEFFGNDCTGLCGV